MTRTAKLLQVLDLVDGLVVEETITHRQVYWRPRSKYDPQPWTNGTYRYSGGECRLTEPGGTDG